MKYPRLLCLALCSLAWSSASAQFLDADDRDEAVGMMLSMEISNEYFMEKCSSDFPDISAEMMRNLDAWEEAESSVLSNYRARLGDFDVIDRNVVASTKATLLAAAVSTRLELVKTPYRYRQYCQIRFQELADGAWRKRTPNAFRMLEK